MTKRTVIVDLQDPNANFQKHFRNYLSSKYFSTLIECKDMISGGYLRISCSENSLFCKKMRSIYSIGYVCLTVSVLDSFRIRDSSTVYFEPRIMKKEKALELFPEFFI